MAQLRNIKSYEIGRCINEAVFLNYLHGLIKESILNHMIGPYVNEAAFLN